jgi:2-keto-4-pentenoate hydratase/2-oxohepta-3-ene-1,7-dioic acid hydratase in catechol pathway
LAERTFWFILQPSAFIIHFPGDLVLRLATIQASGGPVVVGVHSDSGSEKFVDLKAADPGLPATILGILSASGGLDKARAALGEGIKAGRFVTGTFLAPIVRPPKILCIGLNYRDHAKETNATIPTEPIVFSKFATAINNPGAPIVLPRVSTKVDYEAELVVVLGKGGKNIPAATAMAHVAGYMNGNDVSARDWQTEKPGKQWLLGKTPDTFAPIGPYLVTADEVPDFRKLPIKLTLNGQIMQDSTTAELIFGVDQLIEHISKLVTLEPGDLIFTGTPPGVGVARKPQVFLQAGDKVEIEIGGLGTLSNPVVAE